MKPAIPEQSLATFDAATAPNNPKVQCVENRNPIGVSQSNPQRPAWENNRRLKIKNIGVYGDEYRCKEISNFQRFAKHSFLN